MALGSIEFTTISRSQEYTQIKQNEDNRPTVEQNVIGTQNQKNEEHKAREVLESEQSVWQEKKFDARDKGSNEYQGDGGQNRKKKQVKDQVIVNGHKSFDIKI